MASHLTITSSTAGSSAPRGVAGLTAADGNTASNVFEAMLGLGGKPTETPAQPSNSSLDLNSAINLSLGFGGAGADNAEDPEAVAALVDAVIPIQQNLLTTPAFSDVVDGLADLKAKLAAGEPLDIAALKKLDTALADLAKALDINLSALPSLDELSAMVAALPDDGSFEAKLTAAFAPIAQTLLSGAATPTDATGDLPELVQSIGDKLASLLSALNSKDLTPEQLAKLGLEVDSDLDAALAKLNAKPVAAEAPVLAPPKLEVPDAVLNGKANVDASAPADPAVKPVETSESTDGLKPIGANDNQSDSSRNDSKPDERKSSDVRPTAVAAPVDTKPEPQATQQTVPAARVDAVAAPRVVQVGYQTSQQQLNLPQLAFELVRQVSEGNTRFQIRLDPAELGKIDVRLDIDASGQVNARLTVEKAETLDMMQRDQRGLEKALQQAGLDGAKTTLEFSLKQNPFSGGQHGQNGNGRQSLFGTNSADLDEAPAPTVNLYRGSLSASGVNIIA